MTNETLNSRDFIKSLRNKCPKEIYNVIDYYLSVIDRCNLACTIDELDDYLHQYNRMIERNVDGIDLSFDWFILNNVKERDGKNYLS